MEETTQKIDLVVGEVVDPEREVKIGKDGKPVVLENGRFPAGVYQGRGFGQNPQNINRKGRPKGTDWSRLLEKIFEERKAGISDEEFMIHILQQAISADPKMAVAAMRFIEKFMRKPAKETEKTITHRFEIPDTYGDRRLPEPTDRVESDDEYGN